MKKVRLTLFIVLIGFVSVQAQKIKYESSFENAKNLALRQHKPLAILITIQPPVSVPELKNGLDDNTVTEKFNSSFINYKADKDDIASRTIISEFKINRFPSFIFLDEKGGLMFTDVALLSRPQLLLNMANKALADTKEKSLVDYDSVYNAGNHSKFFLRNYISRRESAGIIDNADLIEKYVNDLKVFELNSYDEVLFILKAGPVADSTAYKLAHTNKYLIDSIFETEPIAERVAMNNATISNTMRNAIANKNTARAIAAANFTRSTWNTNFIEGQKSWYLKMLQYYKAVKDTANYLWQAAFFYDHYYMNVSVDSLKRKDSLVFAAAKKNATKSAKLKPGDTSRNGFFTFSFPKNNPFALELNNAAWYFYEAAGNNNDYLLKAMLWSKRSIELDPRATYYDTYAHLLYKLKFYDEAEGMEKKAIELGKEEKSDTQTFREEYEKIKKRVL